MLQTLRLEFNSLDNEWMKAERMNECTEGMKAWMKVYCAAWSQLWCRYGEVCMVASPVTYKWEDKCSIQGYNATKVKGETHWHDQFELHSLKAWVQWKHREIPD